MTEIYSIYDRKAEYYQPFWVERNDSTAIRALEAALRQTEHPLRLHARDYMLFHIGTWQPESGRIDTTTPRHVADAWVVLAGLENQTEN